MSHIAEVNVELRDLTALQRAADALGFELVENAGQFRYYAGQQAPCIHKLKLRDNKEAFEIGLRYTDNTQTTLQPVWDTYGHQGQALVKAGGQQLGLLRQRYTAELSAADLRRKGYRVNIVQKEQKLHVRATK